MPAKILKLQRHHPRMEREPLPEVNPVFDRVKALEAVVHKFQKYLDDRNLADDFEHWYAENK